MFPELSIWLCRRNSLKSPEPLNGDIWIKWMVVGPCLIAGGMHLLLRENYVKYWQRIPFIAFYDAISASSLLFARPKEIIILMDWTVNKDQYPIYAKQFLAAGQVDGCGRLWDEVEGQRPKIIGAIGKVNKKADNGRVVTMRMRINFIALSASQSIPNNNEEGSN